eukprot:CAMPEP_0181328476 /NCGR_PEP_ID=MMETSP1101-20121128/22742_1 /TAXON_ID=46948 /ORGANISM="Rhodomonas abbreviata, Strain Caron Lab Isolate" /LENGTH=693 /DNA_ID=CAMNT_0023437379 /DNA_START=8 /DNA_END=2090 /DNA_ORIENTATION=+
MAGTETESPMAPDNSGEPEAAQNITSAAGTNTTTTDDDLMGGSFKKLQTQAPRTVGAEDSNSKDSVTGLAEELAIDHESIAQGEVPIKLYGILKPVEFVTLSWHRISFKIRKYERDPRTKMRKKETKAILSDISGYVKPGEMVAICGPSGSGKTALLDALGDRIEHAKTGRTMSGEILVNGQPRGSSFHRIASYVYHDPSLSTPFTVKEHMAFAADMLLPHDTHDFDSRRQIADEVIELMGLKSCADVIVGDVFFKGLSSGQVRRLSIGVELLGNPSVILLDEPTSGLDSAAAENVMTHLMDLAKSGRTIIATIHQPPSGVWSCFDKFCLLSEGKQLYFGKASHSLDFFAKHGHPCPPRVNPADHFLRLANTDFPGHADIDTVQRFFDNSPQGRKLQETIQNFRAAPGDTTGRIPLSALQYHNSSWVQFYVLAHRAFLNNAKNPGIFIVRLIMYIGLALMVGVMFLGLGNKFGPSDIVSRVSLLFYVAAFLVFMSVAALPFFILERQVFLRERSNGWYSCRPYVLATFLMSLPGLFLISLCSTILVILPSGLNGFGIFLLDLFLSLMVAEAFMSVIASLVPHYIIGIALGAACYGFFMLCEGFLVIRSDIPPWFIWGHYMAFHTYSFRVFMVNEFQSIPFLDSPQYEDGPAVIAFYEMDNSGIWQDLLVLLAYTIFLQIIYCMILKFGHTGKR